MKYPNPRIAKIRFSKVSEEEVQRLFFKLFDMLRLDDDLVELAEQEQRSIAKQTQSRQWSRGR